MGQRQWRHPDWVGRDQVGLALGPPGQELGRRRGTHQAWVLDAGVRNARDVARRGNAPAIVPDDLVGVGELVDEEAATVFPREDAGVAPALTGDSVDVLVVWLSDVEDVDDEQIAWFGTLDSERSAEDVDTGERGIAHIIGGVVVADGAVEPLSTVSTEGIAVPHRHVGRNIWVPTVVTNVLLISERFLVVEGEQILWHCPTPNLSGQSLEGKMCLRL